MNSKSHPVVVVFSILAGLQVLTGGSALADFIGPDVAGLLVLVIAAVQVSMTFYVQNQTVPLVDTAAYVDTKGQTVAGPAAPLANNSRVEVVQEVPDTY